MIDHVWTLICTRAIIDRDTNNLSAFNIIEQIQIRGEPTPDGVVPIGLEVVSLWMRSDFNVPCRGRWRLSFLSPSGIQIKTVDGELDLSKYERVRARRFFMGLPMSEPGRYRFVLELQNEGKEDWQQVASIPLKVVFQPKQAELQQAEQE